jgi:hypothetical protein
MPVAAARIGAPVLEKSAAEQVVTGPVLVPGRPDRERHQYTRENIRELATSFLPRGEVDAMHGGGAVGHPTENFVTRERQEFEVGGEKRTIPTGSWILSAKVTDERVWRGVERGKLTGFSVFGPVRSIFDDEGEEIDIDEVAVPINEGGDGGSETAVAANAFGGSGYDREIPAAPVGETWTVEFERATHVSLIDDPAVWDARFIVAKSVGSSGGRSGANQEIIMNDELEKRLTAIQKEASASAEAAQDAAESAEAAQDAAESAEGDGDDDGGGDGEVGALREEVGTLSEQVNDLLDAGEGVEGGASDGGDGDDDDAVDGDLDPETVQRLVDEGALSEEALSDLDVEVSGVSVEKRLAALEKAYRQGGRRGRASALDGYGAGSDDESETDGSISAALAGGNGGEEQ